MHLSHQAQTSSNPRHPKYLLLPFASSCLVAIYHDIFDLTSIQTSNVLRRCLVLSADKIPGFLLQLSSFPPTHPPSRPRRRHIARETSQRTSDSSAFFSLRFCVQNHHKIPSSVKTTAWVPIQPRSVSQLPSPRTLLFNLTSPTSITSFFPHHTKRTSSE